MESAKAYEAFAFAESEHSILQARQAFLDGFDRQMNSIEKGNFLTASANKLLPVSAGTTWQKHLFDGTQNLVPSLQTKAELEVAKIVKLLDQQEADILDNERRLRALSLICQINDRAAEVVETQINKYIQVANELAPFRDRKRVMSVSLTNGQH